MTLTIQDLGALGELLGSIAVLATLVYLALQTRQNTMAIAAQLDAQRVDQPVPLHSVLVRAARHVPMAVGSSRARAPDDLQ